MSKKRPLDHQDKQQPQGKKIKKVKKVEKGVAATSSLRLKIQRLKDEDFFITVSGGDQIKQLKQKVHRVLQLATDVVTESRNIRLIYKGKVLTDHKSIEFYKIQNEDTIQLVPFRSKRSFPQESINRRSEIPREETPTGELSPGGGPITFISFSTSFTDDSLRHSQNLRRRLMSVPRAARRIRMGRARDRPVQPNEGERSQRSSPTSSLHCLKDLLQVTIGRVQALEHQICVGSDQNQHRTLVTELIDTLIRRATELRNDVIPNLQRTSISAEVVSEVNALDARNDGLFSFSRDHTTSEEKRNRPLAPYGENKEERKPTEDELKEDIPVSTATPTGTRQMPFRALNLVLSRNDEVNIPSSIIRDFRSQPRGIGQVSRSPTGRGRLYIPRSQERDIMMQGTIISTLMGGLPGANSIVSSNTERTTVGRSMVSLEVGGYQQPTVNTSTTETGQSMPSRSGARASPTTQPNPEHANEGSTTGTRTPNIFVQFLNRFIN